MTEIICACVSGFVAIICAVIAAMASRVKKSTEEALQKEKEKEDRRAEEAFLQMKMIDANSKMTLACITALKNGHANGECEAATAIYEECRQEYEDFLKKVALNDIR